MKKRPTDDALRAALLFLAMATTCVAADARLTPLVQAVKRAKSSVVNIHSKKTAYNSESPFASGKGRQVSGMGTGIVIDARGYIVTNFHVVNKVDSLRVTLEDGSTYTAQVVSYDRRKDLALIKIQPTEAMSIMPIGTSSDLMLGETVIAVGNAFGYEHTVTSGIVSSLSRDVEVNKSQSYKNLIQTDASINPGNSGGPLLNLKGEVVGINVAIRAGAQRIGFAIPIDDARKVIAKLISIEQIDNTYHGLRSHDVKTAEKRQLKVETTVPNSPAATAGFKAGDIIVKAGGVDVIDGVDFERALLGRRAGDEVAVIVRRNDDNTTIRLTLSGRSGRDVVGAPVDMVVRANNENDQANVAQQAWKMLGIRLSQLVDVEPALAGSRHRGGMRVTQVRPGGPADTNGIEPGDILLGLHLWYTIRYEDISYVLNHPQLATFSPVKFHILRNRETMWGMIQPDPTAKN
jgi:serine protease Do